MQVWSRITSIMPVKRIISIGDDPTFAGFALADAYPIHRYNSCLVKAHVCPMTFELGQPALKSPTAACNTSHMDATLAYQLTSTSLEAVGQCPVQQWGRIGQRGKQFLSANRVNSRPDDAVSAYLVQRSLPACIIQAHQTTSPQRPCMRTASGYNTAYRSLHK